MKNKILIIGGNGFIGKNLSLFLSNKKHTIYTSHHNTKDSKTNNFTKSTNSYLLDVTNLLQFKKLLQKIKPTYIVYLASYGNSSDQEDFNKMFNVNIIGLKNLLLASEYIKYKKIIITGSSSEYGFKDKAINETDYLSPNSFYSATKGSAALIAQAYGRIKNKPILILRLFSVYGPNEKKSRFIPTAINAFINSKEINLTPGSIKRDFIYVDDVSKAIELSLYKKTDPGDIFNIGTGIQTSNDNIIKILKKITKKNIKINKGGFKPRTWDTDNWKADIKKAKHELGWHPSHNLESGLKLTYSWWLENNEKK